MERYEHLLADVCAVSISPKEPLDVLTLGVQKPTYLTHQSAEARRWKQVLDNDRDYNIDTLRLALSMAKPRTLMIDCFDHQASPWIKVVDKICEANLV